MKIKGVTGPAGVCAEVIAISFWLTIINETSKYHQNEAGDERNHMAVLPAF